MKDGGGPSAVTRSMRRWFIIYHQIKCRNRQIPLASVERHPHKLTIRELAEESRIPQPILYTRIQKGCLSCRNAGGASKRTNLMFADPNTVAALKTIRATPRRNGDESRQRPKAVNPPEAPVSPYYRCYQIHNVDGKRQPTFASQCAQKPGEKTNFTKTCGLSDSLPRLGRYDFLQRAKTKHSCPGATNSAFT